MFINSTTNTTANNYLDAWKAWTTSTTSTADTYTYSTSWSNKKFKDFAKIYEWIKKPEPDISENDVLKLLEG